MNIHLPKPFRNQSAKSRYNQTLQQKKQSLVFDLDAPDGKTVKTEAGTVMFEGGMAVLPDDGRADEIHGELAAHARHSDQIAIVKHRERQNMDRTHRYFFGRWPQMPWKRAND